MDYAIEKRELFLMQQTYATLVSLANKLENHGDKYFRDLTARQYMAILAVFHLPPEETTIKNIALKLGTTKQNANRMIATIQKKGYITVSSCENDKRAVNIKVTDSGLQTMLECSEIGINFMADIFKDFDEQELAVLWNLLKKLHRFDGEDYSGFEEDATPRFDVETSACRQEC